VLEGLAQEAREWRKGLWADPQPVPLWEWRKRKGELPDPSPRIIILFHVPVYVTNGPHNLSFSVLSSDGCLPTKPCQSKAAP
jgi:hypothetical protein